MTSEGTITTVRATDLPSLLVELPEGTVHYPLAGLEHRIGRDPENDICIRDEFVSKFHARLVYQDTAFTLVDLGSVNKTFVNGQPITEAKLSYGDEIRFASVRCRLVRAESKRTLQQPAARRPSRPSPTHVVVGRTTPMLHFRVPPRRSFRWYLIGGILVLAALLATSFRACQDVQEASRQGWSSAV